MTEEQDRAPAKTKLTREQQYTILYWSTVAKIPIVPCDSRNKGFDFKNWSTFDFSTTDFAANLAAGMYDNGVALVLGKTLPGCPYPYSFALDFDGLDAVMEFFGSWDNVLSLSKKTRIEWHQDKGSLHIVFFSNTGVTKKSYLGLRQKLILYLRMVTYQMKISSSTSHGLKILIE